MVIPKLPKLVPRVRFPSLAAAVFLSQDIGKLVKKLTRHVLTKKAEIAIFVIASRVSSGLF